MFSRPRREVVEIPASCLPWISLQGRLLLVGAGEFLFPGVTSAFPSTQLITLSPSCYRYPLCSRSVPGKGQSRESVHQAVGPSSESGQRPDFPTPISQAELWVSEESRPGLAWLGPGLFSG